MSTINYEDLLKTIPETEYLRSRLGQWSHRGIPATYQFYPGRGGPNLNQANSAINQIKEALMKDFSIDFNLEMSDFLKELHQTKFPMKIEEIKFYKDEEQKTVICRMVLNKTNVLYGMAKCHPKEEFDYEFGKKVALTNAIKDLKKHHRAKIWKYYFEKKGSKKAA